MKLKPPCHFRRPELPPPDPAALARARELVAAGKYDQIDDAGREALRRFHRLHDIMALNSM
jgi:hypothetical protein